MSDKPASATLAESIDLDLALDPDGFAPTQPPDTQPSVSAAPVALIVAADRDRRLYLRARLALAALPLADEADSAAAALELAGAQSYLVALLDAPLPDSDTWTLAGQLRAGPRPVPHVLLTQEPDSWIATLRAWLKRIDAVFGASVEPSRLHDALVRAAR